MSIALTSDFQGGPSNSTSGCRLLSLYRHGLMLETVPNGVCSLVLGADDEATRSHPLARGYDPCQFDGCARAAASPPWSIQTMPTTTELQAYSRLPPWTLASNSSRQLVVKEYAAL